MENLNAEQVKKALECWASGNACEGSRCELFEISPDTCDRWLGRNALALITSQEQRIKELTEENERLKAQKYYIHSDGRIEMIPTVESVRADTVRKMLERLKADAVAVQYHPGKIGVFVGVGNIDDAAREIFECKDER